MALQQETAAEKAHSVSGGRMFAREVSRVFTLATYSDDDAADLLNAEIPPQLGGPAVEEENGRSVRCLGGPLMCIHETAACDGGRSATLVSIVCVDVRAGNVSVEQLREHGPHRAQLRSRLETLLPAEVLLPTLANLTKETWRAVLTHRAIGNNTLGGDAPPMRMEHGGGIPLPCCHSSWSIIPSRG